MADYRTPLPGLLAATLEAAINRLLSLDAESASRLQQLDQRLVRLELEGLGITLNFGFSPQRVKVSLDAEGEPDTVISGTPTALFSMAIPDGDGNWGTPGSRVKIAGDATLARDLERVFSRLDPDWEAQFSAWFGDVLGYQLAAGARGMVKQIRDSVTTLEEMSGEFLQGPSSPLARPGEIRQFGADVDNLRDATDRLEARLRLLRQRKADASGGGEQSS